MYVYYINIVLLLDFNHTIMSRVVCKFPYRESNPGLMAETQPSTPGGVAAVGLFLPRFAEFSVGVLRFALISPMALSNMASSSEAERVRVTSENIQ